MAKTFEELQAEIERDQEALLAKKAKLAIVAKEAIKPLATAFLAACDAAQVPYSEFLPAMPKATATRGTRTRRTAEQKKADAQKIYAAIKVMGQDGAAKADIVKAVGFDLGQTWKDDLEEAGLKISQKGEKAACRYFAK